MVIAYTFLCFFFFNVLNSRFLHRSGIPTQSSSCRNKHQYWKHCAPNNTIVCVRLQVRGIEITIVVLVLMVWVGAIIMFFNRWGKIRMLIPYQPDYKDTQLKVPGTGACITTNTCQNQTGPGFCCSQVSGEVSRAPSRPKYAHFELCDAR